MAQKKFEERIDAMDQEVSEIRVEIRRLPEIEETLASLTKSIERLGVQTKKQQIMLTTIAIDLARGQKTTIRASAESGSKSASSETMGPAGAKLTIGEF